MPTGRPIDGICIDQHGEVLVEFTKTINFLLKGAAKH